MSKCSFIDAFEIVQGWSARIGDQAKYEILEGNHFIYLNNAMRIARIVDKVLGKEDDNY